MSADLVFSDVEPLRNRRHARVRAQAWTSAPIVIALFVACASSASSTGSSAPRTGIAAWQPPAMEPAFVWGDKEREGSRSRQMRGGGLAAPVKDVEPEAAFLRPPSQNFYAFEGLIGAGKSTLLARLEQRGVSIIPEPLKAWQDSGIFAAFYSDMPRWSYTFQTSAFVTRVQAVEDALAASPQIRNFVGERSWFADAYVFERLLHRDGHINEIEHKAYEQWWVWLNSKAPRTRGIIYLRARPETCLARIKKRQRSEESGIPLEYLEGLYVQHEKWLVEKQTPYGPETTKILVLDANPEFEKDEKRVDGMIHAIEEFMRKCDVEAAEERSRSVSAHRGVQRTLSGTELPKGTIYWDGV